MKVKNATIENLYEAMKIVNQKFDSNIEFNRSPKYRDKQIIFTLRVKDSKLAGHRRGFSFNGKSPKRLISACWHVHGEFFDALLSVNDDAEIITRDGKIYKSSGVVMGNWQDSNIGNVYNPLYFSEACDCEK